MSGHKFQGGIMSKERIADLTARAEAAEGREKALREALAGLPKYWRTKADHLRGTSGEVACKHAAADLEAALAAAPPAPAEADSTLRNVMLAASRAKRLMTLPSGKRHDSKVIALLAHILRFCEEAGVVPSILRTVTIDDIDNAVDAAQEAGDAHRQAEGVGVGSGESQPDALGHVWETSDPNVLNHTCKNCGLFRNSIAASGMRCRHSSQPNARIWNCRDGISHENGCPHPEGDLFRSRSPQPGQPTSGDAKCEGEHWDESDKQPINADSHKRDLDLRAAKLEHDAALKALTKRLEDIERYLAEQDEGISDEGLAQRPASGKVR